MAVRFRVAALCNLAAAIILTVAPVLAAVPEGVSPGALDRMTDVEGRCPTFIWGAVPEARAYEVVVYRLRPELYASSTGKLEFSPSDEVLFARVPGGATAWQPELADGLEPGGSYVWFVRAVMSEEAGEVIEEGDWSAARFFSIPAMPSAEQVRQALEVLQRWEAANGNGSPTPSSVAVSDAATAPAADSGSGLGLEPSRSKSVPTATAAIKGSIPDATGETYGVVGISNSPDGAGVGAANTGGGPDLVLDGAVPANLSEVGVDRPSASPQAFAFSNTGGGGMTLQIDSVDVVTTATDRDTVGALSCGPGELPKWTGASWVCAPDLDTDTLSGLSCGNWEIPKWTGSAWECYIDWNTLFALGCTTDQIAKHNGAEWECSEDNDTTYTMGPGLIVENGEINIDPTAFSTRLITLDDSDFTGFMSSITTGADGLGLVAYYRAGSMCVAHCDDAACSTATITTVDASGGVGEYPSIAIGPDGFGLISYYDNPNAQLKVAHCGDPTCTTAEITILDTIGQVGKWTSIAIGIDGLGIISYFDDSNNALKVAHCDDAACSTARTTVLDDSSYVGTHTSIAIGTDGRAIISYHADSLGDLKIAHCDDIPCNSAYLATLDSVGDVGECTSIAIGGDGLPLISYWDETNSDLKVAHCSHIACFTRSVTTLDSEGWVGRHGTSIAIGANGYGLISYHDSTNTALKVAHCAGATCSSAVTATIDNDGEVGRWSSIVVGADGRGLVTYWDQTAEHLKAAHLGIGVP